jgi:2,3-bisphosphoglycerate-dependent phosphoglycerate mutase
MEAPAITRHRRPFLAPLWLTLLAALVIAALGLSFYRDAGTTVVLLVRPAEKEPGTIADPPISAEGEERAEHLAHMFGDAGDGVGLDAIYVSEDRRAQQMAAPLAERLHLTPVIFSGTAAPAVAARLLHEHAGGSILAIASGAAFAQLLRALSGAELPPRGVDEADALYIVSIPSVGRTRVVRVRF